MMIMMVERTLNGLDVVTTDEWAWARRQNCVC